MTPAATITNILNSTIDSVRNVIPAGIIIEKPVRYFHSDAHAPLSVAVDMIGEVRGRLIIEGNETVFSSIGQLMFGMRLEGEMLQSFTCELGNMIAGNLATQVSQMRISMDITPPTVLIGQMDAGNFANAIAVPVNIEQQGKLNIILIIEQES